MKRKNNIYISLSNPFTEIVAQIFWIIKNWRVAQRLSIGFSIILLQLVTSGFSLADPEPLKPARLKLGFYAHSATEVASLSDIEVSMNFWAKEFMTQGAREIGFEITDGGAVLFDTMVDMRNAVERGEIDMVIAPPILLVRYFKRHELQDGFAGVLAGKRSDSILVVTRRDKNIKNIGDLKGKHVLLPANDDFAEMYLDSLFLEHFHKPIQKVAGSIDKQNKSSRIVLDIYFNKADVGVVYLNAFEVTSELNPDIAQKLTILEQYSIKSRSFSFFVRGYPFAKEMSSLADYKFKNSERSKQILEVFKTSEIDTCKISELEAFEKFYQRYQSLKKQYQP